MDAIPSNSDMSSCSRSTMDPEWKMSATDSSSYDDNSENSDTKETLDNSPVVENGDTKENTAIQEILDDSPILDVISENLADKPKPAVFANSRLDMKNVELDVRTFQENNQNKDTKKATVQAVRLFNDVMYELSQNTGNDYVPLDETPIEMLPEKLCRFFMVLKKKTGEYYNASSLQTFYQSIARHLQSAPNNSVDIKQDSRF